MSQTEGCVEEYSAHISRRLYDCLCFDFVDSVPNKNHLALDFCIDSGNSLEIDVVEGIVSVVGEDS